MIWADPTFVPGYLVGAQMLLSDNKRGTSFPHLQSSLATRRRNRATNTPQEPYSTLWYILTHKLLPIDVERASLLRSA